MKQQLVGTWFGRKLESARNQWDLLKTLVLRPEETGTLVNDQFATWLTCRLCADGRVFIDVGAHYGSVTAGTLAHSNPRKIIAIEAMTSKSKFLKQKFPEVTVIETAVGETTGQTKFYVNLKQTGYSSLAPSPTNLGKQKTSEIIVTARRLDEIVHDTDVDVVKIDVEGAEVGVIRGGHRVLETSRPLILFESGPLLQNTLGYTLEQLWQEFARLDYVIVIPTRLPHDDQPLDRAGFIEAHSYPRRTTNYFAVPRERRISARERARFILSQSAFRPLGW